MHFSIIRVLALCIASTAAAGGTPALFTAILDPSAPLPPRTMSSNPVQVNFTALDANPAQLLVALPGVGDFTATRVRWEARNGGYNWIGRTPGHDVILSVDGVRITGFVRGGTETYSLLTGLQGAAYTYAMQRMIGAAFPSDFDPTPQPIQKGISVVLGSTIVPERDCIGAANDPIDVLVVYSPQALAAAGGDFSLLSNQVHNAIASANVTLSNSDVSATLSLADLKASPASLVEQGTSADYTSVRGNAEVATLRRNARADTVTYLVSQGLVNPGQPYCGVTTAMRRTGTLGFGYAYAPNAYNVVTWQCGIQNNDLSHETGHNLGLQHNPGFTTTTPAAALYPYAFGHAVDGQFRDDMSGEVTTGSGANCPNGCPRQLFFSNPSLNFFGTPTGIVDQRDNAQTYRRMYRCVNTFAEVIFRNGFE